MNVTINDACNLESPMVIRRNNVKYLFSFFRSHSVFASERSEYRIITRSEYHNEQMNRCDAITTAFAPLSLTFRQMKIHLG